ncbi:MAG: hypothetical protein U0793_24060 [Gemmataceae bacterium]
MTWQRFACFRVAGVALALIAATPGPARAQVVSLTVALNTPCPYGVAN